MDTARCLTGESPSIVNISPPFSNFDFLEKRQADWFSGRPALSRIFSQARREKCNTLVVEKLPLANELADEVQELKGYYPDYQDGGAWRLSFFTTSFEKPAMVEQLDPQDYRGYAIIRKDIIPSKSREISHVFESVFVKFDHLHNFVPTSAVYKAICCGREFEIPGILYCQQNTLNKTCAQVALRSLLSAQSPDRAITYSEINQTAQRSDPWNGLSSDQIRRVLTHFKIHYQDLDYTAPTDASKQEQLRRKVPYHRFIYTGMESGMGGLVGFQFAGQASRHIIPFFGHTFNQDTWAPRASSAYFHVGPSTKYIPSDEWVSSFIGHDDNFGSNYCIPRRFIDPEQVKYIVSLLPYSIPGSPLVAEARAIDFLYKYYSQIDASTPWGDRFKAHINQQDTVARPLLIRKPDYVKHLKGMSDWEGNTENKTLIDQIETILPDCFWMVELSLPELYSANYSKVGELILTVESAGNQIDFSMLRIPGHYALKAHDGALHPILSELKSHVPLYTQKPGLLSFEHRCR